MNAARRADKGWCSVVTSVSFAEHDASRYTVAISSGATPGKPRMPGTLTDKGGLALTSTLTGSSVTRKLLIINWWSLGNYPACVGLYKSGYRLVDGASARVVEPRFESFASRNSTISDGGA